jgi:hypothetical protein
MGGVCGTHGRGVICAQYFGWNLNFLCVRVSDVLILQKKFFTCCAPFLNTFYTFYMQQNYIFKTMTISLK